MQRHALRPARTSFAVSIPGLWAAFALAGCVGSASDHPPQATPTQGALVLHVDVDHFGATSDYHEVTVAPPAQPATTACGVDKAGACCIVPASRPDSKPSSPAGPPTLSAGAISLTDHTTARAIGSIAYDSTWGYGYISKLSALWRPGDQIAVAAPGDELAGFSLVVDTPEAIGGVTPALGFGDGRPVVSRDADLTVTWTPDASSRKMTVELTPYFTVDTGNPQVVCEVPDAAGQVTVSHELLAFPGYSSGAQGVDARLELIRTLPTAGASAGVSVITSAQIAGEVLLQ